MISSIKPKDRKKMNKERHELLNEGFKLGRCFVLNELEKWVKERGFCKVPQSETVHIFKINPQVILDKINSMREKK